MGWCLQLCYSGAWIVVHDVDPGGPAGYPAPSVRVTGDDSKGRIIKQLRIALEA